MSYQCIYSIILIFVFIYGLAIGSFLNVCIFRIPRQEEVVKKHSHCMTCGYTLRWYDNIPLFSYLFLRGKCRKCGTRLSLQYPLVEGLNGILYVVIFLANGLTWSSVVYCLLTSALIVLSVIDWRTFTIPNGINLFILILGVITTAVDGYMNGIGTISNHLIGMVAVSGFLLVLYLVSAGRAIGGGDIKLMAAVGLIIGWKESILAFFLGCVIGSVIHVIRMKVSGAQHRLAMGPYLAVGIFLTICWGRIAIDWYLGLLGF